MVWIDTTIYAESPENRNVRNAKKRWTSDGVVYSRVRGGQGGRRRLRRDVGSTTPLHLYLTFQPASMSAPAHSVR